MLTVKFKKYLSVCVFMLKVVVLIVAAPYALNQNKFKLKTFFKPPEAGSLNKSSCLAPALGVAKCIIVIDMILVTLCCAT
jgi:hypothetical protein